MQEEDDRSCKTMQNYLVQTGACLLTKWQFPFPIWTSHRPRITRASHLFGISMLSFSGINMIHTQNSLKYVLCFPHIVETCRNIPNALSAQIFDQEALTGCTSPDSPTNRPWPSQLVQCQLNLQNRLLRSFSICSSCTQGFGVPKHLCHHALGRLTEKWTFRAMDGSKQDPIHMHTSWQKVDTK